MRVKNRLLNFGNNIIYQDDNFFNFSLDSVLLANFVSINLTDKKIIDFCTGNAPIPMFLSYKTKNEIIGVELQKEIYDLAIKSVKENKLVNVKGNTNNIGKICNVKINDAKTWSLDGEIE